MKLIKGAFLADGERSDILIKNGVIAFTGTYSGDEAAVEVVNADGLTALPAFFDLHVHLRDPGLTYKEDIVSGLAAAYNGGVTTVLCMPNTRPVLDTPELIRYAVEKSRPTGVRLLPIAAVTRGLNGKELCDFEALLMAGAVGFSDDGKPVSTNELLIEAMKQIKELDSCLFAHCEVPELAAGGLMNDGEISHRLGIKGIPREAEDLGTARELEAARLTGARLHICHVSTRGSVELIRRAKASGVSVTAETCPHYFSLTDELLLSRDADYRMNPPLRTADDVEAIIEGLCDGTLDAISTDHAPHSPEEKGDFLKSPFGVVGLETSFAASYTYLVKASRLSLRRLIELNSYNPADIIRVDRNDISVGKKANFVLADLNEKWVVSPDEFKSKARNSCFKGMELQGRIKAVIRS